MLFNFLKYVSLHFRKPFELHFVVEMKVPVYDCELPIESRMIRNVNNRLGREGEDKEKLEERVKRGSCHDR